MNNRILIKQSSFKQNQILQNSKLYQHFLLIQALYKYNYKIDLPFLQ